ncbi:helix-turn-helix transcriptional regulator [Phenylobacterium sp.]|uniref:ArsR/SmtB family transcription factor n=1 Tax=Phenylobacterium sp. TaxID=1871053 RepID=UPI002619D3CF|nr:metalloregulator ArsR/SmtB family transcription factor [Phenylobacterium sp.]
MSEALTQRANAEAAAERLRVLAHPTRLMILSLLRSGEQSVGDIERRLGLKQPGLSQQLAELRQAKLVATRREAKSVLYRLAGEQTATLLSLLELAARPADSARPFRPATDFKEFRPRPAEAAMFARVSAPLAARR